MDYYKRFFLLDLGLVQNLVAGEDLEETAKFLTRFYGEHIRPTQLEEIDVDEWGGLDSLQDAAMNHHRFAL
ncbi:MAG: hypothetical protein Q8L47_01405 [bacterium]|nr:hypothetical protein [bacterium]